MRRSRLLSILLVPASVLALSACSEQLDQATNDLAATALEEAVATQLDQAGITLEDAPECSTDLSRDGAALTGDASCEGTAAGGAPVRAEFDGTLSGSGCEGSLEVYVDDESVASMEQVPDCSVSF